MQLSRSSTFPLIAGGNNRAESLGDNYWAKCAQPVVQGPHLYVLSRGMDSREWAPADSSRTGVSKVICRKYNLSDFEGSATKLDFNNASDTGEIPLPLTGSDEPIIIFNSSLGKLFDLNTGLPGFTQVERDYRNQPCPVQHAMKSNGLPTGAIVADDGVTGHAGRWRELQLGEWNDHVVIQTSSDKWLFLVSVFYQYNSNANSYGQTDYYKNRLKDVPITPPWSSLPQNYTPKAAILTFEASGGTLRDATSWKFLGEAVINSGTSKSPLATNIGPIIKHGTSIYMLAPNGNTGGRDLAKLGSALNMCEWSIVKTGAIPSSSTVTVPPIRKHNKTYDQRTRIVGRGFTYKENSSAPEYAYALLPGSHLFTDWPSGIGMWRIPVTNIESNIWQECPWNPILQRGPSEGGTWQLSPFLTPSGALYTNGSNNLNFLYQTWSILPLRPGPTTTYQTEAYGGEWARKMRIKDYAGMAAGRTHKHIGYLRGLNRLLLGSWDGLSNIIEGVNVNIRNIGTNKYLCHNDSASPDKVYGDSALDGNGGWVITKIPEQPTYVTIRPHLSSTSLRLMPIADSGGNRRKNGEKMEVQTKPARNSWDRDPWTTIPSDVDNGLPVNIPENAFHGANMLDAPHPENFHCDWYIVLHGSGVTSGKQYYDVSFVNRETGMALVSEGASTIIQRPPFGQNNEVWRVIQHAP